MDLQRCKLYSRAIRDLKRLQGQLTPQDFAAYGYANQLENYRVEWAKSLHAGGAK